MSVSSADNWKVCQVYVGGGVNFEFLSYCWAFYNEIDGVYPIKGLTLQKMADACSWVQKNEPHWCGGDSDDRISACNVLLASNPDLKDPY